MRTIGTLPSASEADTFTAYLLTQDIAAHHEHEQDGWTIWIKNEDQVAAAKEALAHFRGAPSDDRYRGVQAKAHELQRQEETRRLSAKQNLVEMRGKWSSGAAGGASISFRETPLTLTLMALTIFVGALTSLGEGPSDALDNLAFCKITYDPVADQFVPQNGFHDIRRGEIWRLVTPIFIHYGVAHIIFNMMILFSLGTRAERRYGTWRLGLLILAIAILSNVAQYLFEGNPRFGGMSGVNCGLLGYIWMKVRFDPQANMQLGNQTVVIMLGWVFLCMIARFPAFQPVLGALGNVANTAHFVGLAVGMAAAFVFPIIGEKRA